MYQPVEAPSAISPRRKHKIDFVYKSCTVHSIRMNYHHPNTKDHPLFCDECGQPRALSPLCKSVHFYYVPDLELGAPVTTQEMYDVNETLLNMWSMREHKTVALLGKDHAL